MQPAARIKSQNAHETHENPERKTTSWCGRVVKVVEYAAWAGVLGFACLLFTYRPRSHRLEKSNNTALASEQLKDYPCKESAIRVDGRDNWKQLEVLDNKSAICALRFFVETRFRDDPPSSIPTAGLSAYLHVLKEVVAWQDPDDCKPCTQLLAEAAREERVEALEQLWPYATMAQKTHAAASWIDREITVSLDKMPSLLREHLRGLSKDDARGIINCLNDAVRRNNAAFVKEFIALNPKLLTFSGSSIYSPNILYSQIFEVFGKIDLHKVHLLARAYLLEPNSGGEEVLLRLFYSGMWEMRHPMFRRVVDPAMWLAVMQTINKAGLRLTSEQLIKLVDNDDAMRLKARDLEPLIEGQKQELLNELLDKVLPKTHRESLEIAEVLVRNGAKPLKKTLDDLAANSFGDELTEKKLRAFLPHTGI